MRFVQSVSFQSELFANELIHTHIEINRSTEPTDRPTDQTSKRMNERNRYIPHLFIQTYTHARTHTNLNARKHFLPLLLQLPIGS